MDEGDSDADRRLDAFEAKTEEPVDVSSADMPPPAMVTIITDADTVTPAPVVKVEMLVQNPVEQPAMPQGSSTQPGTADVAGCLGGELFG